MKFAIEPSFLPREPWASLVTYWHRWLIPAVLIAGVSAVYAWKAPVWWEASQALIVRNEAAGSQNAPGKFGNLEEMKTVQETALELVKSTAVLQAALQQAGAAATASAVEEFRDHIKLSPPRGAEFGKTEVFYLRVRNVDPAQARTLNQAVRQQLCQRFQQLRDAKASSIIEDFTHTVQLARADLSESSARVAEVEAKAGSDLAELRFLSESATSDSALRRTLTDVAAELRAAEATHRANQELAHLVAAAQHDPGRLLATPNRLLESQPALRRLKDGLVDAQLATARTQGKMSADHPSVLSAKQAEEEIARQLHEELTMAARGLDVELRLGADRVAALHRQWNDGTQRLSNLAGVRTQYTALLAECRNRETILQRAEQALSDARAARASAQASSLITAIDAPEAGTNPVGPGWVTLVASGILVGLLVGLGLLALSLPAAHPAPAIDLTHPSRPNTSDRLTDFPIMTDLASKLRATPPL